MDFAIANYGNQDPGVRHPMVTLVDDTEWLHATPETFSLAIACAVQLKPLVCVPSTSTTGGKAVYGAVSLLSLRADNPVKAVVFSSQSNISQILVEKLGVRRSVLRLPR